MMGTRRKRTPQRQSEAGFLCDRTTEVREMRTAETILNIIQDRGKRKLPLDDVYRQLYNPAMYLRSYAKLYKNQGAMTPGITEETVDGMSREKIAKIIEAIRYERWQRTPERRILKEKPKGGKRPLGIPMSHAYCTPSHALWVSIRGQAGGPAYSEYTPHPFPSASAAV